MPLQSLLWTALPNGVTPDGRSLRLSVLLSPRLDPQGERPRLDSFDDFRVWPNRLAQARFTVRLGTREVTLGLADADATLGLPDAAAWTALLPPDTPVRASAFRDYADHAVLSYDAVGVHDLLREVYARLATDDDELPTVGALLDRNSPLAPVVAGVAAIDRESAGKEGPRDVGRAFAQFVHDGFASVKDPTARLLAPVQLFHTPPTAPAVQEYTEEQRKGPHGVRPQARWRTYEQTPLPTAAALVESLDFHRIVSAMNQYPRLLRRLGLVVDFLVPRSAFAAGADQPLRVDVALGGSMPAGRASRSASPHTRTRLEVTAGGAVFEAVPRPAPAPGDLRVRGGLLQLDDERFALLQADVDGGALKLMNFARSLGRHATPARLVEPVTLHERRAGAPALRTAGLQLVQRRRGAMLAQRFQRNRALEQSVQRLFARTPGGTPPELWAEDLVRGWRLDVLDRTAGAWRSVCERVADYRLDGGAVALTGLREEGTVRLAATTSPDPATNANVVWLHETLTAWTGWSLVARPPGRTITPDDAAGDANAPPVRDGAPDVPPGVRLRTSFVAAPNSLPRLRYGRSYTARARVVDLAGNSLPPRSTDYATESATFRGGTFHRFEPVQPPAVALVRAGDTLHAPRAGESMERLAIRTFNDTFDDPVPTPDVARRWAVPPRVSVREAELHGALDAGGRVDAAAYAMLVVRDRELGAVELPVAEPPLQPAIPQSPGTYAVLGEGDALPYLPDPLCTRVAARVFGLRFPSATVIEIPLYPDGRAWPDAAPFQVHACAARDADDVPRFVEATRTLLVPLPRAARATVRLSAMLPTQALAYLGVWQWVTPAARAALERRALHGQLWLLTPWRELELVHAVQRPLLLPTMTLAHDVLARGAGDTSARPVFRARCSLRSTARVDLEAAWHDPKDDPGTAAPVSVARSEHAFAVKITTPATYAPQNADVPALGAPEHTITGIDEIGVGVTTSGDDAATLDRRLPARRHEFGDTRYRRVEYRLEGTSRFREFMPPDLLTEAAAGGTRRATDTHVAVTGPTVRAWVPSSAPPPAPAVLYVVPTFGWSRGQSAQGKHTSWRRGGGLRVYLDRPWCVSGYGEMLAVVLPPAGFVGEPNAPPYKDVVTQWGADPAWRAPFVDGVAPTAADFPLARTARDPSGAWLPPFAPPGEADQPPTPFPMRALAHPSARPGVHAPVDVAPHDVRWDAERRLWYCDVELTFGRAYYPFVRLALARYQPVSLAGAHLSPIVLADFAQLTPHRGVSITRTRVVRQRQVRVFGHRPEESAGHREAFDHRVPMPDPGRPGQTRLVMPSDIARTTVVEVWVETLDPGASEDFGWRRDEGAPVVPAAPTAAAGRPAGAEAARARDLHARREFTLLAREGLAELVEDWATLWGGTVTLPADAPAGTRHRLVVAEYEEHLVDDETPYDTLLHRKGRRLVFVEHVALA